MKPDIHPKYNIVKVICSCGHTFETASTVNKDVLHIEVCSNCHPFYTGKQKIIDTAGRVEKFQNRYNKTTKSTATKAEPANDKEDTKKSTEQSETNKDK